MKLIASLMMIALMAITTASQSKNESKGDCCGTGAACCYPGSPCCM